MYLGNAVVCPLSQFLAMSYYSIVEPSVIDEELLKKAIQQQYQGSETDPFRDASNLDPSEITTLRLDYKSSVSSFLLMALFS